MKRVAVFGNAGGGKSTLARRLADLTRLPLHVVDMIQFIDGFGCVASAWERFAAADTLIYVDLPLSIHYWWVTKRFIKGLFASPKGWPENSPLWSSTLSSYRVIPRCHRYLTPRYRQLVVDAGASKWVHHLRSPAEIRVFLATAEREQLRHGATRKP
jgi:adenylate kinase family enzyme